MTLRAGGNLASPALLLLVSGLMEGTGEVAVRRGGLGGPWEPVSDALFPCGLGARAANNPGSPTEGLGSAEEAERELCVVFLSCQDMRKVLM